MNLGLDYSLFSFFIYFLVVYEYVETNEIERRPRCIPLESENINANPYHFSLMSEPSARIQSFLDVSLIFPIDRIENYNNYSSLSMMLSDQLKVLFNRNISSSSSELFSNIIFKSMEELILNITLDDDDDYNLSQSVIEFFQKKHQNSLHILKEKNLNQESELIELFTHDYSSNEIIGEYLVTNQSSYPFKTSIHHNVSINILYESYKSPEEPNWTDSQTPSSNLFSFGIGRGNVRTNIYSSSAAYENRLSDHISVLKESSIKYIDQFDNEKYFLEKLKHLNISIDSELLNLTNSSESCTIAVCSTSIRVITVPFKCFGGDAFSTESAVSQYTVIAGNSINNTVNCNFEVENECSKGLKKNLRIIKNKEHVFTNFSNSLSYGEHGLPVVFKKISNNQKYSLELTEDGNLILKYRNKRIWDNKMGFFIEPDYEVRIRINEKGHLIEGKFN
jgi:hypothetical protein